MPSLVEDVFVFNPQHRILICKPCGFAVAPQHLTAHIKNKHAEISGYDSGFEFAVSRTKIPAVAISEALSAKYDLIDPNTQHIPRPLPSEPPIKHLKLIPGYQCTRCDFVRGKTKYAIDQIKIHFNVHRTIPRKKGRPSRAANVWEADKEPIFKEVYCQRFFGAGHNSSYFPVNALFGVQEPQTKRLMPKPDRIRAILNDQFHASQTEQQIRAQSYNTSVAKTEVSPWLDMTRWPRYFDGLDMTKVAPLGYVPNPNTEAALVVVADSFDRIIEQSYRSISEDRINVFDQAKINSFISDRSGNQQRMIMVKLQKSTFRSYKDLWKRLLCFVYRTSLPSQAIPLPHRFTTEQLALLDKTMLLANRLLPYRSSGSDHAL